MTKFTVLSLLTSFAFVSLTQTIQVINNTSGLVTFMAACPDKLSYCEVIRGYHKICPGEVCSLEGNNFYSIVTVMYPEYAIDAKHVQFDIGTTDEADTVSFVEVDNDIIAIKEEHKGQVRQLKKTVCPQS